MMRRRFIFVAALGILLLAIAGLGGGAQAGTQDSSSGSRISAVGSASHSLVLANSEPALLGHPVAGQQTEQISSSTIARSINLHNNRVARLKPLTPISFIIDDGSQEAVFGLNTSYHGIPLIAINRFTPNSGDFPFTINQIGVQFPDATNANGDLTGRNIDLLVYEDPTGSGDPTNASKIYQQTFTIQVADGLTFSNYPVYVPAQGPGDIYIGFSNTYDHGNNQPYTYPVPIDRDSSQQRSWIASNVSGADPDYNDLANNIILSLIDSFGCCLAGNFDIRATGETGVLETPTPVPPTPTVTPTYTHTPGPSPTPGPSNSPTPTIGPPCGAFSTAAGATCSSASTYDYSFTFYVESGCSTGATGPATLAFEVGSPGGPFVLFDHQTRQVTFPPGPTLVTFTGTLTETNIPPRYTQYYIGFASSVRYGAYAQTTISSLCSITTPTVTPVTATATATPTMAIPTVASATPTSCTLVFSDVPVGSTFYTHVHCLACRGIINGYPDGTFKPNNDVTRGQLSKIVSNAAGFDDTQANQMFQDVPVGSAFFQYVGRLASRGYISGYSCGGPGEACVPPANLPYFRPNNHATRGQISKIVSNAAGLSDSPSGQQFEDVAVGSAFYTYTYRLVSRGVMSGYACGGAGEPCVPPANLPYFRPNNNATRGQTSKIVANTFFPNCQTPAIGAQDLRPVAYHPDSAPPALPVQPEPPHTVLYDQYDHISSNGTNSQNYSDLPTYSDMGADDFVVPAGQTWTINEVDVSGRMEGNGQVDSFNVTLYTDAGLPGTAMYTATNLAYIIPIQGEYDISLTAPAVVGPGTYWLMVQANHPSIYAGGGEWYWSNRSLQSNHAAAWINPGNGWGTTCNEDTGWGVRWTCQGDLPNPDQVWRLLGTTGGAATNTPSPTNTATYTPLPTQTPGGPSATPVPSNTATRTAVAPTITVTSTPNSVGTSTSTPTSPASPPPVGSVTPTSCAISFMDVPPGSTFYPYVRCLACRGIINGYPDGTFKPNNQVTRGQLSKIVSNSAGFNDTQPHEMFQDVPLGSTFQVYIGRLAFRGYISGYPCGGQGEPCIPPANLPYFRPDNHATRGQISKIVSNAAGFSDPPSGQQFEDVAVGSTYYTYTYRLVSRSIMSGYPCGGPGEPCVPPANLPYFRPSNNATRGQTSKIVANTFFPNCATPAQRPDGAIR